MLTAVGYEIKQVYSQMLYVWITRARKIYASTNRTDLIVAFLFQDITNGTIVLRKPLQVTDRVYILYILLIYFIRREVYELKYFFQRNTSNIFTKRLNPRTFYGYKLFRYLYMRCKIVILSRFP